jgi:hypothetical protein
MRIFNKFLQCETHSWCTFTHIQRFQIYLLQPQEDFKQNKNKKNKCEDNLKKKKEKKIN